jgi:hypothetical protein
MSLLSLEKRAEAKLAFEHGLRLKPGNAQMKQQLERLGREGKGKENQQGASAAAASPGFRRFLADVTGATETTATGAGACCPASPSGSPLQKEPAGSPLGPAAAAGAPATPASAPSAPEPGPAEPSPQQLAEAQKTLGNERYKEGKYEDAVRCSMLTFCSSSALFRPLQCMASPMPPSRHYTLLRSSSAIILPQYGLWCRCPPAFRGRPLSWGRPRLAASLHPGWLRPYGEKLMF